MRFFFFICSRHNDLPWNIRKFLKNQLREFRFDDLRDTHPWSRSAWSHTDLRRLKEGMVAAQVSAMITATTFREKTLIRWKVEPRPKTDDIYIYIFWTSNYSLRSIATFLPEQSGKYSLEEEVGERAGASPIWNTFREKSFLPRATIYSRTKITSSTLFRFLPSFFPRSVAGPRRNRTTIRVRITLEKRSSSYVGSPRISRIERAIFRENWNGA